MCFVPEGGWQAHSDIFSLQVWDFESLQCVQTLDGHTNDVTSVICWDSFLLSGSLDNKIKVCFFCFL